MRVWRLLVVFGLFLAMVSVIPAGPSSASSVAWQGDWVGNVGSDGFVLAEFPGVGDVVSLPPGVTFSLVQGNRYSWASGVIDVRALEAADEVSRAVGTWWDYNEIVMTLTFAEAYEGLVSVYGLDWDSGDRRQALTITAPGSTFVDSITGSFNQGAWSSTEVAVPAGGTVAISVARTGAYNAVVGGVFLGGAGVPYSAPVPTQLVPQEAPQGDWVDMVGSAGYVLAAWENGSDASSLPSGVTYSVASGTPYLWASSTSDVRALQGPGGTGRKVGVWYDPAGVDIVLNFAQGFNGPLAIYSVDWDSHARRHDVTISDGTTQFVAQHTESMHGGTWVVADVAVPAGGAVTISTTTTGSYNSVISGVFLGGGAPQSPGALVPQMAPQGSWNDHVGQDGYVLAAWNGLADVVDLPAGVAFSAEPVPSELIGCRRQPMCGRWNRRTGRRVGWVCGTATACRASSSPSILRDRVQR